MFLRGRVLLLVLCLSVAGKMIGQNAVSTGAISGIVTDTAGAVVPDAQVELTNLNTGIKQSNKTNATGLRCF